MNPDKAKARLINSAIRYLGYRPRSQKEMFDYLLKKSKDEELVNQVLEHVNNLGLLNDQTFADWLIHSRLEYKLKGPRYIRMELKKFGINRDISNQALQTIEFEAQYQACLKLLHKRRHALAKVSPREAPYKAKQYLYSRGFESDPAQSAIDEYFAQQ